MNVNYLRSFHYFLWDFFSSYRTPFSTSDICQSSNSSLLCYIGTGTAKCFFWQTFCVPVYENVSSMIYILNSWPNNFHLLRRDGSGDNFFGISLKIMALGVFPSLKLKQRENRYSSGSFSKANCAKRMQRRASRFSRKKTFPSHHASLKLHLHHHHF